MDKLKKYNQMHILKYEQELNANEKKELYNQIETLDFSYLECFNKKEEKKEIQITPIKALTINEINRNKNEYKKIGLEAIKRGEVGMLLLAGGMGTRLGSNDPKGMYNVGLTHNLYIFECLFNEALRVVKEAGVMIPFFIMTSDVNDEKTKTFLREKNYFGYDEKYIKFFIQEMAPCTDLNGKILLDKKNRIATSPNGNGGWFNSLLNNAEAKKMLEDFNLKWINVFAVDNVLQKVADPVFVGATIKSGAEVGAKVIRKVDPYEKVGVMCNKNGRPSVIEYMDLSDEMAHETGEDGERLYNFGVILNYLFNVDLLYKIKDDKLPIHVVTKKIECLDENGNAIKPEQPNGHKFEMLCVDMVELSSSCLPYEVEREREFAPIKNKTGVDSVESARVLLQKNGIKL